MIYTLAVILLLVGAAAAGLLAITLWDAGVPMLRQAGTARTGKLRPPR